MCSMNEDFRPAHAFGDMKNHLWAFDPEREIRAAVKLFSRAPMGEEAHARLHRDAQAAGTLGHPNIATVIGTGELEGRPWVATELVSGVSLAQVQNFREANPRASLKDWLMVMEAKMEIRARGAT